ncbi:cap binding protein [Lophiostoma macrostomum CBS 122681]|uniref:Cap binding protein n=1 Tax=Lophiostoma macrostomum CBS 122681 TaxID=1314788 RepID=A0A6A6T4A1_9PLEO|nr:cap binding protein [Lophiostoma macrostomum CBS 122681]
MADLAVGHDDREDRRDRGGRNNNRGGGRKRRHEEDDDYQFDRRGPPAQRRRRDEGPPRQRFEEAPLAKLRRMLLHIASSLKLPQIEAVEIAEGLGENLDDDNLKTEFFGIMIQLVLEQPLKIPFVAAVAFYGNDVNPEIMTEALTRVITRTQQALDSGNWKELKLLLRFLACLQSRFEGDGIFAFLNQLFDTVVDLQSANENDVVGIELVKIILLTIPYALVAGGARFQDNAKELLKNTGIVAGNMLPVEGLIHSYSTDSEETPIAYHSVIGLLQTQLMNEAEAGWVFACIPRFDSQALRKPDSEEAPTMHAFPAFNIPSPVNPGPTPLFPEAYFSLFTNQELETVPDISNIAASLLRDTIVDTFDQLDFNREAAAKMLIDVDCYWTIDTFANRGTQIDKFKEAVGDKLLWKTEDLIIDAIFSQLFKLPSPEHKLAYYHSLITQCCKIAPAAIAPSLGRGIRAIYKNLDIMDLELTYRFLDWFSHHLSNFEFRWRWAEWLDELTLSDLHPKKAFIKAALDREIRLSFAKRVRSTVPEEIQLLIPERLDKDDSPDFKFEDPLETPYAAEGQALIVQLRKKENFQETIEKIQQQATEHGIEDPFVPSTDVLVTAICRLGAKSLSHVLSCIERARDQLMVAVEASDAARRQVIASVVEYWKDQPGVAVRIIDILLNYTILTPMSVVRWALGDYLGAGEALSKSWVFEMVSNTVTKVTKRNRQIADARLQKNLLQEQADFAEATLTNDRQSARELFKYIEDAVRGVAEGSADILLEKEASGEISAEDGQLIRAWGKRWHIVSLRKAQVEESVVGEEAMEARIKLLDAQSAAEAEAAAATEGNGIKEEESPSIANGDAGLL